MLKGKKSNIIKFDNFYYITFTNQMPIHIVSKPIGKTPLQVIRELQKNKKYVVYIFYFLFFIFSFRSGSVCPIILI